MKSVHDHKGGGGIPKKLDWPHMWLDGKLSKLDQGQRLFLLFISLIKHVSYSNCF